ncbi:MAG: basic amino acid/polyamine antiporter [Muribaculaceae bacterium]|nr:basic amino acid/polyamine antiporter [Muribaculaceae bacterium]
MEENNKKLGFGALVGIIFGMMVGSGLYNIPQNLAIGAGPGAVALSWVITAAGMLLLVATFKILADRCPELNAGIYQYAKEGFGNFAGFNIAWGYWLCTAFANVAYAVMLNDSFGAFFPALLPHRWPTLLFGTGLIWLMYFLVAGGIRTARLLNNILAIVKVAAIALIVVILCLNIHLGIFRLNYLDELADTSSLWTQVKSTMMVTLWCFIGIEGAVMMSARAKRSRDVGKATVTGFFTAWLLYVLVSMLCYGVATRARLAGLDNPSVAYVLHDLCGAWAYYFVILAVIVSLLGGWLAWTLVCAQVPYEAAQVKIFPRSFLRLNRHGMPAFGLFVSSVVMECFLIMVMVADDVYMAALVITGVMILPAYLSGGMYLFKLTLRPERLGLQTRRHVLRCRIVSGLCVAYCLWMIYAGGIKLFLFSSVFYLAGIGFYLKARHERRAEGTLRFTPADVVTSVLLTVGVISSAILLAKGDVPF